MPDVKPGAVDINPRDTNELAKGGTLRLVLFDDWPTTFNPLHADSSAEYLQLAKAMYPRAFKVGPDGHFAVNTDYFTEVEMISTWPRQIVRYTINPAAEWSNGTPITWLDIESQVRAFKDDRYTVQTKAGFERVESVTMGVDDRQAVLSFKFPYSEWRGMFSGYGMLLPQSMTATPGSFNNGQVKGPGPSAGPFIISGLSKAKKIILSRNPRWWGTEPVLESIEYSVLGSTLPDEVLDDDEVLKNVDAIPLTSAEQTAKAEAKSFKIRRARGFDRTMIALNADTTPGNDDRELREAILMAIDREEIVRFLERGLTAYPVPLDSHIFVPGQECYEGHGKPVEFDPYGASGKLDNLGWRLDGAVRKKSGEALIVRVTPSATDTELAAILKTDLARIGVQLQVQPQPAADPDDDGSPEGTPGHPKYELALFHLPSDAFARSTMEWAFKSDPKGESKGKIAIERPEIDEAIASVMADTTEPCKANEVDKKLWGLRRTLPLIQSLDLVAVRGNVANYGAFGMADIDYTRIGFTS